MTTPVEKRNNIKFCKFHGEVGYNTDECMHLKRQIEELLKAGKLSYVIKELKQNSGKDQPKINKKEEASNKDKALAILMIQPWQRVAKQRITQSFSPDPKISFFALGEEEGTEGPMIIEAEIRGHFIHRISSSPYNGIIGRPGVRKIQAVPSTAHGMLKFPVAGGILTLKSNRIIPIECAAVSRPERQPPAAHQAIEERIKVAINPDYPKQTIMIGSTLTEEGQNKLCDLLQRNLDVFAWKPADMTGVPRHIAEHRLNIREGCPPVRQKRRGQAADRKQAIQEEVEKLIDAGRAKVEWKAGKLEQHHIVYLAAAKEAISAVLMTKREAKQMPIYFVSRALRGPKMNYTSMENWFWHWLQKWSIELGEYAIHYRLRVFVKGQILADFIVERPEEDSLDTPIEVEEELPELWILFTDGSSCADGSGARLILTNLEGAELTYALRFRFEATNNEDEYEALIAGLRIAEEMGVRNLQANVDSRLVANQVNRTYTAKEADMIRYLEKVRALANGTLPAETNKARAVRRKSQRFAVTNGVLYKNSFLRPWLRCVGPLQANYVLREIHEGSCSMHAGTRSVVAKALQNGYYWPTMHKDARAPRRACQDCQFYRPIPRNPQQKLTPITSL
ncbi:reverse transcriptase domain-containing protein [Tanacetum coccineum]